MDMFPSALADLIIDYLSLQEAVELQLPLTTPNLQRRVKCNPETLIGMDLTQNEIESLTASVLLGKIPTDFINNPYIYNDIPLFVRRLIIERLVPRYTAKMVGELVTSAIVNEPRGNDYIKIIELLCQHAIVHHFAMVYDVILTEAIQYDLTNLIDAILGDPDYIPSMDDFEYAIKQGKEDLALRLVDLLYADGADFSELLRCNPHNGNRIIYCSGMLRLFDRVLGTHLDNDSLNIVLIKAIRDPSLMRVVLNNPAVRPIMVVKLLLDEVMSREMFDLIRHHPRMQLIHSRYWDQLSANVE